MTLAGRTAEPFLPGACEVANSVGVFGELSQLTGGMAKVEGRNIRFNHSSPIEFAVHPFSEVV